LRLEFGLVEADVGDALADEERVLAHGAHELALLDLDLKE